MKILLSAVAVSAALATAASAGSPVTVVAPTPVVVAPAPAMAANDWSGFYLGAGYASYSSTETFLGDLDGTGYGGFAGYNFQRGSMVFGAEVEVGLSAYDVGPFSGDLATADVKARLGYAFGNTMVYGFAGASSLASEFGGNDVEYSGYNYGAGAAYKFNSGLFVGMEYMLRDLEGTGIVDGQELDAAHAAIRAGWQF